MGGTTCIRHPLIRALVLVALGGAVPAAAAAQSKAPERAEPARVATRQPDIRHEEPRRQEPTPRAAPADRAPPAKARPAVRPDPKADARRAGEPFLRRRRP